MAFNAGTYKPTLKDFRPGWIEVTIDAGDAFGRKNWRVRLAAWCIAIGARLINATWRIQRPAPKYTPGELSERHLQKIADMVDEHARLQKLSDRELVQECLFSNAADFVIVEEMMSRLSPGWENEDPEDTDNPAPAEHPELPATSHQQSTPPDMRGGEQEGASLPQTRTSATDGTARMAGKNGPAADCTAVTGDGAGAAAGPVTPSSNPKCPKCGRDSYADFDNDQGDHWVCTSCYLNWK